MIRMIGYLFGIAVLWAPAMAGEWVQEGADSFSSGLFAGTEIDSLGRVSLASFRGVNLALDAVASSGPNTLRGSRSVTDGNTDTEWRFDNEVEVLGKWIRIDLGGDRGVESSASPAGQDGCPTAAVFRQRLPPRSGAGRPRPTIGCWWRNRRKTPARRLIRRWIRRGLRRSCGRGAVAGVGPLCAPAADAGRPTQLGLHRRGGSVRRGFPV